VSCVEEQARLSIKNILLATKPSQSSEAILAYVVGLSRRYGASISLADVTSAEVICAIVSNREVDLVVVARGQRLQKLGTACIVEDILPIVPCPVLIIGPAVTYTQLARKALERIVYVTDFSTSSLAALPYAVALAQDTEAQLALVHVAEKTTMGPFHYGNPRNVIFRKRLDSLIPAGSDFLGKSEFVVDHGDRVQGLVRVAAKLNASLIVMSVRETPAAASAQMLLPVDGQVVCRAPCPVLMVPGQESSVVRR
jgi:nucleotide-binding universal stress UspA family protein